MSNNNETVFLSQTSVETKISKQNDLDAFTVGYDSFYPGQKIIGFKNAEYLEKLPYEGGFSTVHKIYDCEDNTFLVMKVPQRAFIKDKFFLDMIRQEANLLAGLEPHPNIVKAVHFKEENGVPYLFTQYIEGETLEKIISRENKNMNKFTGQQVLTIFIEICRGMDYLYNHGIIHLDLKPKNIIINNEDGRLKIIDFGLGRTKTKQLEISRREGLTSEVIVPGKSKTAYITNDQQAAIGTPPYMSPEHFRGLQFCDTRSDIYSMGVLMYEVVSGEKPFYAGTAEEYLRLHSTAMPKPLSGFRHELAETILTCLKKDPADRYPTFGTLLEKLENLYFAESGECYPNDPAVNSSAVDLQFRSAMFANMGDVRSSLSYAEKALQEDPDHVYSLITKANALSQLDRSNKALEVVDQALAKEPDNVWGLSVRAHILELHWNHAEAITCLEEALNYYHPDRVSIYIQLADVYFQSDREIEAELLLEEAEREAGISQQLVLAKARHYVKSKQKERADNLLQPYLEEDWDGSIHNYYGVILGNISDLQAAERFFTRALELSPDNSIFAGNYIFCQNGLADQDLNQLLQTVAFAEKWLETYKPGVAFYQGLAETYTKISKLNRKASVYEPKAFNCLKKALEMEPGNVQYAVNIINYFKSLEMTKEALEFGLNYEKSLNVEKTVLIEDLFYEIGILYRDLDMLEKEYAYLRKAQELNKYNNYLIACEYVEILSQTKRFEEAIYYAEKNVNTINFPFNEVMGCFRKAGRPELAIAYRQQALDKYPGNQNCINNLIDEYVDCGFIDEAIQVGEKWVEHQPGIFLNALSRAYKQKGEYEKLLQNSLCGYNVTSSVFRAKEVIDSYLLIEKPLEAVEFGDKVFEELINSKWGFSDFVIALADAVFACNMEEKILAYFERAVYRKNNHGLIEFDSDFADTLLSDLMSKKQKETYLKLAQGWMHIETNHADFINRLGLCFEHNGQFQQAIPFFLKAWEIDPHKTKYIINACKVLALSETKNPAALDVCLQWIRSSEDVPVNVLIEMGKYFKSFNQSEALACFEKAIRIYPDDLQAANQYLLLIRELKRSSEAIEFGTRWIERNEPDYSFLNTLGCAYYDASRNEEAAVCFLKAHELSPCSLAVAANYLDACNKNSWYNNTIEFAQTWFEAGKKINDSFIWSWNKALNSIEDTEETNDISGTPHQQFFLGHNLLDLTDYKYFYISPDGKYIITDKHELIDPVSGQLLQKFAAEGCIYFTPDGKYFASGVAGGGEVGIWELATGKCLKTYDIEGEALENICITENIIAIMSKTYASVWEMQTGNKLGTFKAKPDGTWNVIKLAVSQDGKYLAVPDNNCAVVYNIQTGAIHRRFEAHPEHKCSSLNISKDGRYLATGGVHIAKIFEIESGACILELADAHWTWIDGVMFNADNRLLLTKGWDDDRCKLWDIESGVCVKTFDKGDGQDYMYYLQSLGFARHELSLISSVICLESFSKCTDRKFFGEKMSYATRNNVRVLNLVKGNLISVCKLPWETNVVYDLSRDEEMIAVGGEEYAVFLFVPKIDIPLCWFNCESSRINSIAISFDSKFIAATSWGSIPDFAVWEIITGRKINLPLLGEYSNQLFFYGETNQIVFVNSKDRVRIWDIESCQLINDYQISGKSNSSTIYKTPDNKYMYYQGNDPDKTIKLVDAFSGEIVWARSFRGMSLYSLCISTDGKLLGGRANGFIFIWEVETGKCLKKLWFKGINIQLTDFQILPNNKTIAITLAARGVTEYYDIWTNKLLVKEYGVNQGYLWTAPPDEASPCGWVWTDRLELVKVYQRNLDGTNSAITDEAARRGYLERYNRQDIVMARLNDYAEYERIIANLTSDKEQNIIPDK